MSHFPQLPRPSPLQVFGLILSFCSHRLTLLVCAVSTSAESTPTVAAESASAAAWSIPGASSSAGVASASAQSSADSASTIASTSTSESSTSASAEISSTSSGTSSDTYASVPTSSSVSSSVSTTSAPSSTITSSPSSLGANSTVPSLITSTRLNATLTSSLSPAPTNATLTRALAAAATTSTLCAAKWLAPTMISGTGTLPKPTSFVKRQPTGLGLGLEGASWKIVGTSECCLRRGSWPELTAALGLLLLLPLSTDIYWICNNEDTLPKAQLTSKTRIREALAIAVAMGANTVSRLLLRRTGPPSLLISSTRRFVSSRAEPASELSILSSLSWVASIKST